MTTRLKIQQLEKRFDQTLNSQGHGFVIRHVTQDDRLVDENGYLLSKRKVIKLKKEDKESKNMIIYLRNYAAPVKNL